MRFRKTFFCDLFNFGGTLAHKLVIKKRSFVFTGAFEVKDIPVGISVVI